MRIAITIVVIIGVLASIGFGVFWVTDYNSAKEELASISGSAKDVGMDVGNDLLKEYEGRKNSGYALIPGGVLSLISVIMLGKLKKISAVIFLLSAIVPAVIFPASLLATFMLIIGGILALFYKPKAPVTEATAA